MECDQNFMLGLLREINKRKFNNLKLGFTLIWKNYGEDKEDFKDEMDSFFLF